MSDTKLTRYANMYLQRNEMPFKLGRFSITRLCYVEG